MGVCVVAGGRCRRISPDFLKTISDGGFQPSAVQMVFARAHFCLDYGVKEWVRFSPKMVLQRTAPGGTKHG